MAVAYATTLQVTRLNNVTAAIDVHASPAKLAIYNASYATKLAEFTLGDPSFGAAGGSPTAVINLNGTPMNTNVIGAGGTAAIARITTGDGTTVIVNNLTVTVTGGGGDIQLNSVTLGSGQQVTLTLGTITHSAWVP